MTLGKKILKTGKSRIFLSHGNNSVVLHRTVLDGDDEVNVEDEEEVDDVNNDDNDDTAIVNEMKVDNDVEDERVKNGVGKVITYRILLV